MTVTRVTDVTIPQGLVEVMRGRPAASGVDGDTWLAALPELLTDCASRWRLDSVDRVWHGVTALVIGCHQAGRPVALKITWPHPEARHEHLALRHWAGRGAVELVAADPSRWAMLLERLDGDRTLGSAPLLDACEVIGNLHRLLDRPAPPQLDRVSDLAPAWIDRLRRGSAQVPRRLTDQATSMLDGLLEDAHEPRLVHQDLHFDNVLAADRAPWLAIDPKPVAGQWAYAVAPVLWNRWGEVAAAYNVRSHLRLRAGVVAEAAGLDEDRVHAWSFVRVVCDAVDETDESAPDREMVSRYITIAKAMTD